MSAVTATVQPRPCLCFNPCSLHRRCPYCGSGWARGDPDAWPAAQRLAARCAGLGERAEPLRCVHDVLVGRASGRGHVRGGARGCEPRTARCRTLARARGLLRRAAARAMRLTRDPRARACLAGSCMVHVTISRRVQRIKILSLLDLPCDHCGRRASRAWRCSSRAARTGSCGSRPRCCARPPSRAPRRPRRRAASKRRWLQVGLSGGWGCRGCPCSEGASACQLRAPVLFHWLGKCASANL